MNLNGKIFNYFAECEKRGQRYMVLQGGRRSGKTFSVLQKMLIDCNNEHNICNVASMTAEQGRLGAYADTETIINSEPYFASVYSIWKSPREVRHTLNNSKIFFNSYADGERAKGIACDYLFVNEANNFTEQQFVDLLANVRKGVFIDFNPNTDFWIKKYVAENEILQTTWKDNKSNLTETQLQYFAKLKELGDKPDANPIDRYNYLVYYCGQYAELTGKIFNAGNIQRITEIPKDLKNITIFIDPSALRGADFFAMVLAGYSASLGGVVVLDADSVNTGSRELQAKKIKEWCLMYDDVRVYVETNGLVGLDFYDYCRNSDLPVNAWYSKGNKFERITSHYEDITQRMWFLDTAKITDYLRQVYDFDNKCEHDDNIDAIASTAHLHKLIN